MYKQFIYVSSLWKLGSISGRSLMRPGKKGLSGTWDEDHQQQELLFDQNIHFLLRLNGWYHSPNCTDHQALGITPFLRKCSLTTPIWQISMWFTRCQTENTFQRTGSARARKREWTYGRLAVVRKPMGKKHHFSEEAHHFLWGHFLLPCMFQVTMLYSLNALAQLLIHLLCINWANWFG